MNVTLAGMNVDKTTLDTFWERVTASLDHLPESGPGCAYVRELRAFLSNAPLTPETLSAAYARISRDPRPVGELRRLACEDVAKARQSNHAIVFGLGHASVAEHAVFNLDITEISRLAVEFLQHFRLASFTEKSQRYITLTGDYVQPAEMTAAGLDGAFNELVNRQNQLYRDVLPLLEQWFLQQHPDLASTPVGRRTLEGWAKEDARYAIGQATEAQLGMTANARTLENIIQKASIHPLLEVRELGDRLRQAVAGIAPSLIKYLDADDHMVDDLPAFYQSLSKLAPDRDDSTPLSGDPVARLIDVDPHGETRIWATLMFEAGQSSFAQAWEIATLLTPSQKQALLAEGTHHLQEWHHPPRAFETAFMTFECTVSASCFAQLKRHRMGTQIAQPYDPHLGITLPSSVDSVGWAPRFQANAEASASLFHQLASVHPQAAAYALTNGHRRRVLYHLNLRELVLFSRLRQDVHAQWDIRKLADAMVDSVRLAFPFMGRWLGGKDQIAEIRQRLNDTI